MAGRALSTALIGLTPTVLFAQTDGVKYETFYSSFGDATPSVLSPSSSTAKQFGKVVATWNGIVAVSSISMVMDYDTTGTLGTRGRVSVYGSDYLRQYKDYGTDFISPRTNDGYGSSLALWEGTMLVGAPTDDSEGENVGKAYVYYGTNYGSVQELTADHGEAGDYFGYSVAIVHGQGHYGDGMAVVGAYGHDHDRDSTAGQGSVFVYTRDSSYWWELAGKLEPQDFEHHNHGGFGYSLAAYGNSVAVGSYSADKAFVFELMGHLHECPHGEEEEHKEDYPSECLNQRRQLRSLQGGPGDDKKWYTEWKYEQILTVGLEHKPEDAATSQSFGQTVALYNESGVLTLAVAAPADTGTVYVMSIMNRGDVQQGWYPEGYDHHEEDKRQEEADREAEREEREAEEQERREQEEADRQEREQNEPKRSLQHEDDKNRFRTWDPTQNNYGYDKMGNFWILETTLAGSSMNERFGHSMDISSDSLLIGNNPSTYQSGRAVYYQRTFATNNDGSPLVSGPLYNTMWSFSADLQDSLGMEGDHFGFSVSFYDNVAVVGAIMPDIQSDGTFGQGVAYIYDRISMVPVIQSAPTPSPISNEQHFLDKATDTSTAYGKKAMATSVLVGVIVVFSVAYLLYRVTGGSATPYELMFGFSSGKKKGSGKQVRLASMDDSGFSTSTSSGSVRGSSAVKTRADSGGYSNLDSSDSSVMSRSTPTRTPTPPSTKPYGGRERSDVQSSPISTAPLPKAPPVPAVGSSTSASSNPYLAHRPGLAGTPQRKFTPTSHQSPSSDF